MNLRLFSIALLTSAIPLAVLSDPKFSLSKEDFVAAEEISRDGETLISVKLSKSGKAKIKKFNQSRLDKTIHTEIGGVSSEFKLREPITGDHLEMGPYKPVEAKAIIEDIHKK